MIEISSKKIDFKKKNEIILKNIELDSDLKCFILIDTDEKKFSEIILNKIIDNVIGKISKDSAYKDLSIALENTNVAIKSWKQDGGLEGELNIIIAILNEKTLIFSTIGSPSCYLIKKDNEIMEITEKDDNKKEFSFISSGEISGEELVIMCTDRLLHHISKSDILDSIEVNEINDIASNLEITMVEEKANKNIGFIVVKNAYFKEEKDNILCHLKNYSFRLLDNNFIKKTIALCLVSKDKILVQKKGIRAAILLLGIIFSFFILYTTISSLVTKTGKTEVINDSKKDLQDAKEFISLASENISNQDIFSENIKKAESLLTSLREKNLFLTDIQKLDDDIQTIKKQFNLVETFDESDDKLIYKGLPTGTVKVTEIKGSIYAVTKNSVIGPIIGGKTPTEYFFKEIGNDSFIDIVNIDTDIFLVTKNGKIVSFEKNGFFKYYDVKGQTKWEDFKSIKTFNTYLYALSINGNQIYKHREFGTSFEQGVPYLSSDDSKTFNDIIDIAIDGGVYLLRKDLSMVKVFKSPTYRVEKLVLNRLPKNYDIESGTTSPKLIASGKLKYVYMFLNNKIWVFKTNSPNFNETKNLTYMGQIDGLNKIIDFTIYRDGEIYALNKNGIYKINFEVSDNKLILK
nr:hypothetical protein [Candidatus Gracilibacteria bacterium]